MDDFDARGHARLVGNVLLALAVLAFAIAAAGLLPEEIFSLPPHFFGSGGAAVVGLALGAAGFWLRRNGS